MLLPDSIPCAIGDLAGPAAPTVGNGWELLARAHTDLHTEVCQVPRWTTLQFAKILNDKGSGSVTISMDDASLFPVGVLALNANPDLAAGLDGWTASGGTASLVAPGPPGGSLPQSIFVVPDGISQNSYAQESGAPFAVVPGQRYTVRCQVWPVTAGSTAILGIVFADQFGAQTPVLVTAAAAAGVWQPFGVTVTAPEGAVAGWPLAGIGAAPGASQTIYVQGIAATYESLEPTELQRSQPASASPVKTVTDLPPGPATPGDYLLAYEHLFEVYRNGKLLFDFTGQTVTEQQVDPSEQRVATVTGPGTVNTLGWARAMPPGFPNIVFKTDAIQDGFAEVDNEGNPALDTNIWNDSAPLDHITLNPQGTCQITARPGTTFLGAAPYDITSSSISAQINVPFLLDGSSGGLDGSQLVEFYVQNAAGDYALLGLNGSQFYARVGTGSAAQLKVFGTYNSNSDLYWRISEDAGAFTFWSSADGQSWTKLWKVPYSWDATNVTVFFAATYDQDNMVAIGVTNINGDIITPTSAGNIFLLTPIMSVWKQLFDQAQQRGTIPFVKTRLTRTTDSFGNPWTDAMSVQIQNGTDLYSLLQSHAGIVNADWVMQPGFELQVGLPVQNASAVSLGTDRSATVIVREAKEVVQRQRVRARDQVANSVGAVNSDGTVVAAQDAVSIARYSQREGWVETAQTVNPDSMTIVLSASVQQTKDEVLSETISILPDRPGATPLEDFDVGDWIGRERPAVGYDYVDVVRVVGIAFSIDSQGNVTCELTVYTYRQWIQEQLQYLVDKFGGQFINAVGTTPVTSIGGTSTIPTVVNPNLGGLADVQVGTDHMDPLVWNALADVWQNTSNDAPSGSPIGLAVGPPGGPKASLVPASGQTLSVDGGANWSLLSAFQGPSGAASESAPCGVTPVVLNEGGANEQLGVLFAAGLAGQQAYALLLTATAADGSVAPTGRIGKLAGGSTATWNFTTVQAF